MTKFNDNWIRKEENAKRVTDDFRQAVAIATDIVNAMKGAFDRLNQITGSTKQTFELLLGLYITFKGLKLASYIGQMATNMGLFATNAGKAAGAGSRDTSAAPPAPPVPPAAPARRRRFGRASARQAGICCSRLRAR